MYWLGRLDVFWPVGCWACVLRREFLARANTSLSIGEKIELN